MVRTKQKEGIVTSYGHRQKTRLSLEKQNKFNLNSKTSANLLFESE